MATVLVTVRFETEDLDQNSESIYLGALEALQMGNYTTSIED